MKKRLLSFITLIGIMTVLLSFFSSSAFAAVASGTCGEEVLWNLESSGKLIISGNGAMNNYTKDNHAPWYSVKSSITEIEIKDTVTSVGAYAFYFCTKVTRVEISGSVTAIGNNAFNTCYNMSELIITDGVVTIEDNAFYNCYDLTNIKIPKSLTTLGEMVFQGCTSISNIEVDSNNKHFCSVDGVLYNKDKTKIIMFPPAKSCYSYVILNSVKTIENRTFDNCISVSEIIIPNSVETIGDYAFRSCTGLTNVSIPNSISYIGSAAFLGCTKLTSIKIPEGIDVIKEMTFNNCISLNDVYIPDSVTVIEKDAFNACGNLTSITIPLNVTSIGNYAFKDCENLKSVAIPKSIRSIWLDAFYNCNALTNVYYMGSEEDWTKISLSTNPSLASAEMHYNCTSAKIKSAVGTSSDQDLTVNVEMEYLFKDGTFILAIYDADDKLVELEKVDLKRSLSTYKIERKIKVSGLGFKVKLFTWDDVNLMSPLCKMVNVL